MRSLAKKRVTNKSRAEMPVSEGILRAAERAGITQPDELGALRKLADAAERSFVNEGTIDGEPTPIEILREAIRCASSDFDLLDESYSNGLGMVDDFVFTRAQRRLQLALALAEYREQFGEQDSGVTS